MAIYWPRLPPEELLLLPGDRESLVALVRQRYALTFAEADAQVDTWLSGLEHELAAAVPSASQPAPAPARTGDEDRAQGEGMGAVPGATSKPSGT